MNINTNIDFNMHNVRGLVLFCNTSESLLELRYHLNCLRTPKERNHPVFFRYCDCPPAKHLLHSNNSAHAFYFVLQLGLQPGQVA